MKRKKKDKIVKNLKSKFERKNNFWSFLFKFKAKRKKKEEGRRLEIFLILVLVFLISILFLKQIFVSFDNLIKNEASREYQEIRIEVKSLENSIKELDNYLMDFNSIDKEERKKLAEKIRQINYQNLHLLKLINAYENDFSLQIFSFRFRELEKIIEETRNVYLISGRLINKFDSLLLFNQIENQQQEVIEKDLELFYQKTEKVLIF
jgi:hypothetical protein